MAKPGNVTIKITPDISKLEAGFKAMAESFEELARLSREAVQKIEAATTDNYCGNPECECGSGHRTGASTRTVPPAGLDG